MSSESELARMARGLRFMEFMSKIFMQEALKGRWSQNYNRAERLVREKVGCDIKVGEFLDSERATPEGLKNLGFTEGIISLFDALLEAFELHVAHRIVGLSPEAKQLLELKKSQTTPPLDSSEQTDGARIV